MLMLHEGAKHLDDIVHLRKDRTLMKLLGFQSIRWPVQRGQNER